MKKRVYVSLVLLITGFSFLYTAGSKETTAAGPPVVVASKIDTEGALLGQMIVKMLESKGIETVDKTEFGPTSVTRKALISREVDIYPEYTGNGQFFFSSNKPEIWENAQKGYAEINNHL